MTESEIQKQIITYLKLSGCLVFRMNSGFSGRNNVKLCPPGTPDLLVVGKKLIWVEVKTATGKLRESQIKMHEKLRKRNQIVVVARSVKDVISALDCID